jgi:hypothetical protein
MNEVEQLRADNQLLRQQVESLYAKIGRLTDLIATMEHQRPKTAAGGAALKGHVINPGESGWVRGKK